jgi:hypothetical protein
MNSSFECLGFNWTIANDGGSENAISVVASGFNLQESCSNPVSIDTKTTQPEDCGCQNMT